MSDAERETDDGREADLEPAEALEDLLEEIVEDLQLDATAEGEERDGVLTGRLDGENVGLFIGRHGQTIDAVQHLAQRTVLPGGRSPVRGGVAAHGVRERVAAARRGGAGGGTPVAQLARTSTVWLVDRQPSESTRSKDRLVDVFSAGPSTSVGTTASVVRTTSIVARLGASMPAPLAMPPMVQPPSGPPR